MCYHFLCWSRLEVCLADYIVCLTVAFEKLCTKYHLLEKMVVGIVGGRCGGGFQGRSEGGPGMPVTPPL